MTALTRLVRARRVLLLASIAFAVLWGAAVAVLLMVAVLLARDVIGWSFAPVEYLTTGGVLAGIAVVLHLLWRNRAVGSNLDVALWVESRVPALRYSLVTLAEGYAGDNGPALEQAVAGVSWASPVRSSLFQRLSIPAVLLLIGTGALVALPGDSLRGLADSAPASGPGAPRSADSSDPFRAFVVLVTPPGYSGQSPQRLNQPETVTSLVGSSLLFEGIGWRLPATMPDTAMPLWLERDGRRRLVVLLPIPDSGPAVQLRIPARDSVLHEASGEIDLSAVMHDDFGLSTGWFEYIVSSGDGESYTFRSGIVGRKSLSNVRQRDLASRISLESLELAAGNIVHLRAVAQDGNTVTGPGTGYSETRTIRISRRGEGDSVSVEQVSRAEGDSSLLSQRMLLILAEALERRRPRLGRDTFLLESRRIAGEQATLRRRVADIIFLRLGSEGSMEEGEDSTAEPLTPEDLLEAAEQATASNAGETLDFSSDETPVVALNRPLLEAYNAMWAAGRELEIGEPRRAIPHMREALEAIQRARQAERIYLRGRPVASVIDLAKVRLAGDLADAAPSGTISQPPDQRTRDALLVRFSRAIGLGPAEIIDSLQLLRIDALGGEPRFAAALGDAVTAIRTRRDATGPLIRARQVLAGPLQAAPGLEPWDIAP